MNLLKINRMLKVDMSDKSGCLVTLANLLNER